MNNHTGWSPHGLTTRWCRHHQEPRLLHDRPPPPPPQWQESACTRGSCCAWTEEFKSSASQKIMRSFQPWQPAFKAGGVASVESGCLTSREQQLQNKTFWFQRLTRFCSGACVGHLRPSFCAGYRCHCQLHPLTCWPTWKGSTQMGQLPLVDSSTVRVSRAWQWSDRKVII